MSRLTERGRALWVLALLSPVIAELLSGSSPPLEFFVPTSFALLLGLYGSGALIVRELAVIWNRGWASVFVLGAAYGILEEGVAVKSFFDPNWMDLGGLGVYGRFLGTNWVWAVWLTIFHAMISISLPILLIWLLYPNLRNTRFLTRRRFQIVFTILFLDVFVCTIALNPFVPAAAMYMLAIAFVFGLSLFAKNLPRSFLGPASLLPSWRPWKFCALGFLTIFLSFMFAGAFVNSSVPPIVTIILIVALNFVSLQLIRDNVGSSSNKPQVVGLASGLLLFMVILGAALQLAGVFGMGVVALVTLIFVIDINRWAMGKGVFVFRVSSFLHGRPKAVGSASGT